MIPGIILAAGASSRMGSPKQLLPWQGKPMLQHVIDTAASELPEVILVLGHAAGQIRTALHLTARVRVVLNPAYSSGQASSLRTGLRAAGDTADGVVILLGDQPTLRAAHIRRVIDAYQRTGGPIVRAVYPDGPGHPVVLAREVWGGLVGIKGDSGARTFIARHPEAVVSLPMEEVSAPLEVDTPEDYRRLLEEGA